ncbi:hypothetical protein CC78DRAFT_536505 [Lojkania enalia]|uniref:Uncharacterized protein n=1 Tax=Lojkania enalia TaxID=147567 RepID=A0A9P4K147_9PLEO|nr:hypothetical protein CC78DRAFT_536505 [Didymosphaeria enalia]
MATSRSHRLQGSLGDSWGAAEYSSEGDASVHSASDMDSEYGSDNDLENQGDILEREDIPAPLLSRSTRGSSRTPQDTPVKTPGSHASQQTRSTKTTPMSKNRSFRSTPASQTMEPSFIMPSMYDSVEGFSNGSPLRNSQMRARKACQPSAQNRPGSMQSSPRLPRPQAPARPDQVEDPLGPWHYISLFCNHVVWPFLRYALSVLGYAADFVKPIFAAAIVLWILLLVLGSTSTFIQSSIRTALSPICIIPGSSYFLPFCGSSNYEPLDHISAFEEVVQVQSSFEDILQTSQDSYALPAAMKHSEASIRDLKTLVKYSKLPSRSQLEVEFQAFIDTAKEASSDLTKYNSRIGRTVDRVLSINTWTKRNLDGLASREASTGSLSRLLVALNPRNSFSATASLQRQIFDIYVDHVREIRQEIDILIQVAQALLLVLNNLDERLDLIHDLATRDGIALGRDHDKLLAQLWTKLGGNQASKNELRRNLGLLKELTRYREQAIRHVSTTLLKLQEINAELENLRDGVAAPEVLGMRDDMLLERCIDAVGMSLDRLEAARGEARMREKQATNKLIGNLEEEYALPGWKGEGMPAVSAKAKVGKK